MSGSTVGPEIEEDNDAHEYREEVETLTRSLHDEFK
jgi:hypothetical protein